MTSQESSQRTRAIELCVDRLRQGDVEAREELMRITCDRLMALTRRMKRDFQRIGRWEQTDDVFQRSALRLCEAMKSVEINDAQHFLRLAATQIRRELIDLSRKYYGPQGMAAHHLTQAAPPRCEDSRGESPLLDPPAPQRPVWSAELHEVIERLPERERDVVDLLWYHGMTHEEAAEIINISTRQVKRIWRSARLRLHDSLGGDPAER